MSARDVAIDTLTFQDLLKLGLEDLPGASQGAWTLHGAVDPGIAILELFAWQFEQRLFMAEQRTDPIVRAGLSLLGLDPPAAAQAARTVLSIIAPGAASLLPAGTAFVLADDTAGRRFALAEDVWALPVTGVAASGRMLAAGDVLELELASDVTAAVGGGELSLLLELEAAPGVAASWRPDAVDVDPPATLRWEAIGPDGARVPVTVRDDTGALRRSGLLRLAWPAVWDTPGSAPRRLVATALSASFTEAVRVHAAHPNAVAAAHRVEHAANVDAQLAGFLPLPGQRVRVPGAAGALCDDDGDVLLSLTERDGARHDWRGVRTLAGSGPADRVVLVDRDRGELVFGDGRSGRIPRPAAAPAAALRYFLGAGPAGNLGPYATWAQEGGAAVAVNPVPADDGREPESSEHARQRAADALSRRDRTVTEEDARELARSTPGLGLRRAHASPGFHPAFPCDPVPGALSVTIVPHAGREAEPPAWTPAPRPDAGALSTTRRELEGARLLGQEIFVLAPVYRRVRVDVVVASTAPAGDMRDRIADALRAYLDPLAGGSERDGWSFGAPVRPSALAGIVQATIGPEAAVARLAVALDDGAPSDCGDLEIGSRELVVLESANVTWIASSPAGGGLR